jgi:hypothetical protein
MGCDIHLYVERREAGKWVPADRWTWDEEEGRWTVKYDDRVYSDRNYDLFAILADVRNGYGFAGVPTGVGFIPISKPRGLPADVSDRIREEAESWGCDGHSHSFHTVAQLMAYDWTQATVKLGVVSAAEFMDWDRYDRGQGKGPDNYAGSVSGAFVKHIPIEEMETITREWRQKLDALRGQKEAWEAIASKFESLYEYTYTQVSWGTAYCERAQNFLARVLPRLWRIGKPEDVRIVFWFDN